MDVNRRFRIQTSFRKSSESEFRSNDAGQLIAVDTQTFDIQKLIVKQLKPMCLQDTIFRLKSQVNHTICSCKIKRRTKILYKSKVNKNLRNCRKKNIHRLEKKTIKGKKRT